MVLPGVVLAAIAVAAAAAGAAVQDQTIEGPILGFAANEEGTQLRPVLGVPGAAVLGPVVTAAAAFRGAVVSPDGDYALALRAEDGVAVVIRLGSNPGAVTPVAGGLANAASLALSPSGGAAALYQPGAKRVQILRGLPEAPVVGREFDLAAIAAEPAAFAVSDDGAIVLVSAMDNGAAVLWVADAAGTVWPMFGIRPSAAAFIPDSRDAIVADDQSRTILVLAELDRTAGRIPLTPYANGLNSYAGIVVSADQRTVFLAAAEGIAATIDVETRIPSVLACRCRPDGIARLGASPVFRLNAVGAQPLTVLDASSSPPRIVVVPHLPQQLSGGGAGR